MKIEKLEQRKRDDKSHNCEMIILTRLNISDNYFKLNKKEIEETLLREKYIDKPLPRYSKTNDSVSLLITHRINNFQLRGWKRENSDDSFSLVGVTSDCLGLIKSSIWGNLERNYFNSICSERNNPMKFNKQLEVFFKLQELNNNPETDIVNLFLTHATDIKQDVVIDHINLDIENEINSYVCGGNVGRTQSILKSYHYGLEKSQTDKFVSHMSFGKIDDEFKITEAFSNKDKEYSKQENIHINFNLSKDIELSLTSKADETEEDTIERAKDIVVRQLTNTILRDTFKKDNLSVVETNLIIGG